MEELLALLQSSEDPAEQEAALKQLVEMGVLGDEMGIENDQLKMAEALRSTPTPEGRQAGRVFTAANPLEHLAAGVQRYRGGKALEEGREAQQGILGKQQEGRLDFLKRYMLGRKDTPNSKVMLSGNPEEEAWEPPTFGF